MVLMAYEEVVTRSQLSDFLGLKPIVITQMADEGKLKKTARGKYDLKASVRMYCDELRQAATGRYKGETAQSLTLERARLAMRQAENYELKNASLRGDLLQAKDVERQWSDALRAVRARFLAIPSRILHRLPHLTRHDSEEIDAEVRAALTELANDHDERDQAEGIPGASASAEATAI